MVLNQLLCHLQPILVITFQNRWDGDTYKVPKQQCMEELFPKNSRLSLVRKPPPYINTQIEKTKKSNTL